MAKLARVRLGVNSPLVRTYPIFATQDVQDKNTGENITICKYVRPVKNGEEWEDKVFKEWVENPSKNDLKGCTISVTTEIIQ